jgi:hypothetical protein
LRRYGVKTFQAEDEIAAAGVAIGASYGGAVGTTGTSGPARRRSTGTTRRCRRPTGTLAPGSASSTPWASTASTSSPSRPPTT